jgi:nicotinic acid mononucleotide adenylyltransferase
MVPRPGQREVPFPKPFQGGTLKGFPVGVSSSQIRARVRAGQPIDHLVTTTVAEAIRDAGLYASPNVK